MNREELLARGRLLVERWCALNRIPPPRVVAHAAGRPPFSVCAFYRAGRIDIWPNSCAAPGRAGRAWSWPGYAVDRTPYGVLAHELGHHVDDAHGSRGGIVAAAWRRRTGEPPLTGYAPNTNEWFAEIFRLFLTNPSLLELLRPKTYALLRGRWLPAETRGWQEVLAGAERQLRAAQNKINAVRREAV